jgi:hypothetical protein
MFWKRRPTSKLKGSRLWYQKMKGLGRRNTLAKYEKPTTYQTKVMNKVKVLLKNGRTDR